MFVGCHAGFLRLACIAGVAVNCISIASAETGAAQQAGPAVDNGNQSAGASNVSTAFDGRWSVFLSCETVGEKRNLVRGYEKRFYVDVRYGHLNGGQGQNGTPGSLFLAGVIQTDGSADIMANGTTGSPDFTIGGAPAGTAYAYAMRGTFSQTSGQTERTGVRPCTAFFQKAK